jgi:hypothetical protein
MQWSAHCNTEDVRWVLRERAATLAGAAAREFVGEVSADVLRTKMRPLVENFLEDLLTWACGVRKVGLGGEFVFVDEAAEAVAALNATFDGGDGSES